MAIASGANVILGYEVESTRGTTPGSAGKVLRVTQGALNLSKGLLTSAEIRTSGLVSDERHGFKTVGGPVSGQLSYGDFDEFLENALRNDWETGPSLSSPGNIGITASTPGAGFAQLDRASGSFSGDGVTVGDGILASGFSNAANNRLWIVQAVGTTTVDVYDAGSNAVTEAAGGGPALEVLDRLRYGNTMKTWSFERQFTDLTTPQYQLFRGVGVQSCQFNVSPESPVTFAAQLLGLTGGDMSASSAWGGAPTAATSNQMFAAFDGRLDINEAAVTTVTSFDFTTNNQRTTQAVVGTDTSPDLFEGTATVQGNLTAFLDDGQVLYTAFVDEEEKRWLFEFAEPGATPNRMWAYFPRLKVNGGDIDYPQSGPVPQSATISALEDATSGIETSLIIYRS